ncbi:hypothetical protein PUN28_001453 [Cardiocondyla obscurior]|uniref:Uncharacterized protein n=1 Tax=Cardiocondyla obscurior TaxID=286306 RepID=A0AAW2H5J3_9HYME
MSLTSRTNRWASRVIIILQLATWNAVGIVLLHRGIITLRRRILETSYVTETDPSTGLESIGFTEHNGISEYDSFTERQSNNKNAEIDQNKSPPHNKNLSRLDVLEITTTVRGTPNSQLDNLIEKDRRVNDYSENEVIMNKISRVARNKKHILNIKDVLREILEKEDTTSISNPGIMKSISTEKEDEQEEDFVENTTQARVRENASDDKVIHDRFGFLLALNKEKFDDGGMMAIALVVVGGIMLLVAPIVIILRAVEDTRQARKLAALQLSEDLPPTYEQAVLMDEAPRYSTLSLNYDHTPPPSPTLSSNNVYSNVP